MIDEQLMENLQRLERYSEALGKVLSVSRGEGRMPSFDEAREADLLSRELVSATKSMPEQPFAGIIDPVLRDEMSERLRVVKQRIADVLKPAGDPVKRRQATRSPLSAAVGSIKAYGNY